MNRGVSSRCLENRTTLQWRLTYFHIRDIMRNCRLMQNFEPRPWLFGRQERMGFSKKVEGKFDWLFPRIHTSREGFSEESLSVLRLWRDKGQKLSHRISRSCAGGRRQFDSTSILRTQSPHTTEWFTLVQTAISLASSEFHGIGHRGSHGKRLEWKKVRERETSWTWMELLLFPESSEEEKE